MMNLLVHLSHLRSMCSLWPSPGQHNATCAWSTGFQYLDFPQRFFLANSILLSASLFMFILFGLHGLLLDFHVSCQFCSKHSDCESSAYLQPRCTFCATPWNHFGVFGTGEKRFTHACWSSWPFEKTNCHACVQHFFVMSRGFDATLGYPGEGPKHRKVTTFVTANLGSLKTNHSWKTFACDLCCVQETRIGRNNLRNSRFDVQSINKDLFPGKMLPGLLQKNGRHRIAHGGTAIIAPSALTKPFDPKDDATGLYAALFETCRCSAVWFQATRNIKALVFSFYGHTGVHSDATAFETNDQYLENIFIIANQFGDVPVVVAGDFQTEPMQYASVAKVATFFGWSDPLDCSHDPDSARPLTYSLDSTFSGPGDHTSSIDGFLLNHVALSALVRCEVMETFDNQHRPVQACFNWEAVVQEGFVHRKTAALDLSNLQFPKDPEEQKHMHDKILNMWNNQHSAVENCGSLEKQWSAINDFCLDVLLQHGATWKPGTQCRGQPPEFAAKSKQTSCISYIKHTTDFLSLKGVCSDVPPHHMIGMLHA